MLLSLNIIWNLELLTYLLLSIISILSLKKLHTTFTKNRYSPTYTNTLIQGTSLFVFTTGKVTEHVIKRFIIGYNKAHLWTSVGYFAGTFSFISLSIFPVLLLLYVESEEGKDLISGSIDGNNSYKNLALFKQAIFDAMIYPALVISKDYRIIDANKAYETYYNCTKHEVIGKHCYEINHRNATPCKNKDEPCPLKVVKETKKGFVTRHHHYRKNEQRVVEITASPIINGDNNFTGIIEIAKDITEDIIAEQERQKLSEELYEMRKHMALRTAIGGIAHEFNNLLAAILGNTELLLLKLGEGFSEKKRLLTIKKAAERASQLIRKMMIYERADFFSKSIINVNELLETMLPELKSYLNDKISLIYSLDPELPEIYADKDSLRQAILNVFINAIESIKNEGTIVVRTYKRTVNKVLYTCIEVQDTGVGIPSEHLSRIFDPFFTTKDVGEGEGLGLSVVKGIVDAHQGFIEVDSSEDRGSRFHLCFISVPSKRT